MKVYALGDVHGRFDLLTKAIERIHATDSERKIIVTLGDYIDRGPQSKQCIDFLMNFQTQPGDQLECLLGNHEQIMVEAYRDRTRENVSFFFQVGGYQTMESYGWDGESSRFWDLIPKAHIEWMENLSVAARFGDRYFVHAGLAPHIEFKHQDHQNFLWIREKFLRAYAGDFPDGKHVVHGHTPHWAGKPDPNVPELLPHRTNLDTGAFASDILTVGVFQYETNEGPLETWSITPND